LECRVAAPLSFFFSFLFAEKKGKKKAVRQHRTPKLHNRGPVMSEDSNAHLSRISTLWTVLRQAHQDNANASQQAQEAILQRYASALFRYLVAAVKDATVADELYQEFALAFVRGDYAGADPSKGRFRNYLKRVLHNLVCDHYRARARQSKEKMLTPEQAVEIPEAQANEADREFADVWKMELLARAWTALEAWQAVHGQPYYQVLRCRMENPDADSPALAERMTATLGVPVNAGMARKYLHHARRTFAELLVEEVRQTLLEPSQDDLVQELIELDLWERCKGVIETQN
jgi:DNA-directed RNA polymerase specialized sigma24 family protein